MCEEACLTQFDEDGDGLAACADDDCWVKGGSCAELCDSDNDEDGDGVSACADSDCWGATGDCPEVCESENDEDGDGKAGCADSQCWFVDGPCKEACTGGNDEDADEKTDCEDEDCRLDPDCAPNFTDDVKAVFIQHCGKCHTGEESLGGLDFSKFEDTQKPSIFCAGITKGECSLVRINEGTMPEDCPGCVPPEDVEQIAYWIEAGMPE